MRLPMVLVLAALALPATAHAGTIGLEGAELVYRSDPGEVDDLLITQSDRASPSEPSAARSASVRAARRSTSTTCARRPA